MAEDDEHLLKDLTEAVESNSIEIHTISFHFNQPKFSWIQPFPRSITIFSSQASFSKSIISILSISIHSIRHLSFHFLKWIPLHFQNIFSFFQIPHTFTSVSFHRNVFHPDSLSCLSQSMKSMSVQEIVFSESSIGSFGTKLFASVLTFNKNVQNLQILNDSIGEEGAEALSKMLEANSTLKTVTILDSIHSAGVPMVSAALGRSRSMEIHVCSGKNSDNSCKMIDLVSETGILRVYRSNLVDICRIVCSMGMNTTIRTMDLTGVRLGSRFAKEFMYLIQENQVLREVRLSKTCLNDKSVVYIATGLFKNKKLERLHLDGNWFGGIGVEHLVCPLSRFSAIQMQANTTLRFLVFGGEKMKFGRRGMAAIVRMLETNQSLKHLGIHGDKGLSSEEIVRLLESLEGNTSMKSLSLRGCRGVKGEAVMEAVMDILEKNPWMEEIDLGETPLEEGGMTEVVYRKLAQNKDDDDDGDDDDMDCVDSFEDMTLAAPKSCRVFFCGEESTGRENLYNSITQYFSTSRIPYLNQVKKTLVGSTELNTEIRITTIKHEETTFSLWNLCGKHYFSYNTHDLMFPGHGGTSFFLVVSSFLRNTTIREPKSPEELRDDLHDWISFVVSSSKATHRDQTAQPNITIVLTDFDRVAIGHPSPNIISAVQNTRDVFQSSVNFFPTVFMVDLMSQTSVSRLANHILETGNVILELSVRVYDVCNELAKLLSEWRAENGGRPIMRWAEFCELCQVKVSSLRIHRRHGGGEMVEKRRRAVACSLHDMGKVLHFSELGFLILDFMWLCNDVIVCLRKIGGRKTGEKNFVRRNELAKDLTRLGFAGSRNLAVVEGEDLVGIMMRMGICYQLDALKHDSFVLVPSLLNESGLKTQWHTTVGADYIYVGRRLEVDASSYSVFFPGFFSRLQVYLHEKLVQSVTLCLEKRLIEFSMNGMHIRIELGGHPPKHIDLLVCSTKNLTETLRFLKQFAISAVHSVSGGASFTEKIIRPECIKSLTPIRHRTTQCLSLHSLKSVLLSLPADSMYEYQHTWDTVHESGPSILQPGFDLARELLSDDEFRDVLNSRYTDLSNLAVELQVQDEEQVSENISGNGIQSGMVDPSFSGIAKGVEVVIRRLRIIENEIRDLKQEIRGLRYYENRLLLELIRKIDFLSTYSISIEDRKIPTMFYFTKTGYTARRLVANIVSGMTTLRLHMLCEFRAEIHAVDGQFGCEVLQIDNRAVRSLAPYTQKFMTLISYAFKIGAHLVAGMGGMIPDLGREMGRLLEMPMVSGSTVGAATGGALGLVAAGALGGAAVGRAVHGRGGGDIGQDMGAAQQWVADFLREKGCCSGKDMAEMFGLWRVRYKNSGQVAWICRRHMQLRGDEIVPFPF